MLLIIFLAVTRILTVIDKTIWYTFLALSIVTPLIFITANTELFEIPKMIFVYLGAIILFFLTLMKFVTLQKITIPKNSIFLTFLIFLVIQTFSTLFSIDSFTSIFGYPSRLNGGLFSQISYLIIFISAYINLDLKRAKDLLASIVLTAFVVSLWGVAGHFGKDPSCLVLTGKLTSTCWQKDFDPTIRIFSTLGQPNWLASYLVLALPAAVALFLVYKKRSGQLLSLIASLAIFAALVMTNSRAGLLGIALGFGTFFALLITNSKSRSWIFKKEIFLKIASLGIIFLIILAIFGKFLFLRLNEALQQNPQATQSEQTALSFAPQSASDGPTESGQIRLIVWQGAIEAFRARPILGWGPETFAYSYYLFRPFEHNQTTEWNFFYNKAHNEFLNYLTNIGIVGFSTYVVFLFIIFKKLFDLAKKLKIGESLMIYASISAIFGYLATIFLGFSTVTTNLIFFLLIGICLLLDPKKEIVDFKIPNIITKFKLYSILAIAIVGLFFLSIPIRIYFADLLANKSESYASDDLNLQFETRLLVSQVFPFKNPFYIADLAYTAALFAASSDDTEVIDHFAESAQNYSQKASSLSPNNIQVTRKIANAYFLIADLPESESARNDYQNKALENASKIITLAPTDPSSYLATAKIQSGLGYEEEAKDNLEKALELKPDYIEAQELLEELK